jgi:hypothetical protein
LKRIKDKKGVKIKAGDYIYNSSDKYEYYQVVEINGELFIEDENSPLGMYRPSDFWEVRNDDIAKHSVQQRLYDADAQSANADCV